MAGFAQWRGDDAGRSGAEERGWPDAAEAFRENRRHHAAQPIALLRALDLLEGLLGIVPDADSPNPLDVLAAAQKKSGQVRQRAPRSRKG